MLALAVKGFEQSVNSPLEWNQAVLDRVPDKVVVNAKIFVNQCIPEPADGQPGNFRMRHFSSIGQAYGCFSHRLKVA